MKTAKIIMSSLQLLPPHPTKIRRKSAKELRVCVFYLFGFAFTESIEEVRVGIVH